MNSPPNAPILLFDGVCNFCAWSVRFVDARDPAKVFRFASLQGEAGRRLLTEHGLDPEKMDSVVLIEGGVAWCESDAALRVCRRLRWPWRWFWIFRLVPKSLRDTAYRFIARHRYGWFGKSDTCMIPTPDLRARFLD